MMLMVADGEAATVGRWRRTLGVASLLLLVAGLVLAPSAVANGIVNLTISGAGQGTVASTSNAVAAPGEFNCTYDGVTQAGACGPATFTGGNFGFQTVVTLTAAPAGGSYLAGWQGTGGSGFERCTEPPQAIETCVVKLNQFGPPTLEADVTARFEPLPDVPLAITGPATAGETVGSLTGAVNPIGFPVADCRFEYGTTTDYGVAVPCAPDASVLGEGEEAVAVSAETEPLEPGTTYHYRLVASNIGGSGVGEDRTFTTTGSPKCAFNLDRRLEQGIGAILLPNCMALEMVSPPKKDAQSANFPDISSGGNRVRFRSSAAIGGAAEVFGPGNSSNSARYVASRGPSGWQTAATAPPGGDFRGGWGSYSPALSFTPDFGAWFQVASTQPEWDSGVASAYQGGLGGLFAALSPMLIPNQFGSGLTKNAVAKGQFVGASGDHSHLLFVPGATGSTPAMPTAYLPGDPQPSKIGEVGADENTYVARRAHGGAPSLELLARDAQYKAWGGECGARLGGISDATTGAGGAAPNGYRNQGAVSADGARTYFSARAAQNEGEPCDATNRLRILERLETPSGPWIGELFGNECVRISPPCSDADGDDLYQGASNDQTKVYFTSNRQLVDDDLDGFGVTGTGKTTTSSKSVTSVVTATGTGTLTAGSKGVGEVEADSGEFLVGQRITGTGIPANTDIAAVGVESLELSKAATSSGPQSISAGAKPFAVGQTITGPGIAGGTKITAVSGQTLTLSLFPVGSSGSDITLTAIDECHVSLAAAGCDLYLYDANLPAGERLIQVSRGEDVPGEHQAGSKAQVFNGVPAISADGSRVYFVAGGVLTADASPKGEQPSVGAPNLYVWNRDTESTSFIGALAAADGPPSAFGPRERLWGGEGTWRGNAYPVPISAPLGHADGDGHVLLFESKAALTADDGDGGNRDVFRYDADADEIVRISKALPGGQDDGSFDVTSRAFLKAASGTDYAQENRWVSDDGQVIVFTTAEGLIPSDLNGVTDTYMWSEEQLVRLPGTSDPLGNLHDKPTLTESGDEVAFTTFEPLLSNDRDVSVDTYVARVDGGFLEPKVAEPCNPLTEGSCNGATSQAAAGTGIGSQSSSDGNIVSQRNCRSAGSRAARLSKRAKQLRRSARRAAHARVAKRRARKTRRLAKKARAFSRNAKRCRRQNRRAGR
jgi:hypothetical protein